jgi:3-phosphoshikimate 1-carboxyvinyltransferase
MERMERIVRPARKLSGEATVPGELESASQALVLAALAQGESRIHNTPPSCGRLVGLLRDLGVSISEETGVLVVRGQGRLGFSPPRDTVELKGLGEEALYLLALLCGQEFSTRVRLGEGQEEASQLLALLAQARAEAHRDGENQWRVGGGRPLAPTTCAAAELSSGIKTALLVAGLYAQGPTVLREQLKTGERAERPLRQWGVEVVRRRQETEGEWALSIEAGQELQARELEIAGDPPLALPLVVAALGLRRSELRLRRLALRPGRRFFFDLLRQLGAPLTLEENDDGTTDLIVRSGKLKSTRIAKGRAEKLLDQMPLLAVLATQTEGEFVLRDVEALRRGEYDFVAHLVQQLRLVEAKVGEFPEGLVVEGGFPLRGAAIDTRNDPWLTFAFAVAGLWAETEITLSHTQCLEGVFPSFFATLEKLQERKR